LWDVNEAFGNFNMGMSLTTLQNLSMYYISTPGTNRPLYNKMLANTTYKAALTNEFCYMMNYFNNALLDPKIDSLKNLIMIDVQNDTNKFYTYNDFLNNITTNVNVSQGTGTITVPGIKSFIQARNTALVNELATWSCFVGVGETNSSINFVMFPNPANGAEVRIISPEEIKSLEVFNAILQNVMKVETQRTRVSIVHYTN